MPDIFSSGSTITVGATSTTEVLGARQGRRIEFCISNTGANAVFLICSSVDVANAANKGVYLPPGAISNSNERFPEQERVTAYSTAGSTLAVNERVIL